MRLMNTRSIALALGIAALAACAPDPLDRDQDDRYPLLADYVSGGRTHSTVQLDSSHS